MTATAIAEPAIETMIETELWTSFVSLIRSYAAAAGLNMSAMPQIEEAKNSVAIVASGIRMQLHFAPTTRRVEFHKHTETGALLTSGSFEILLDGTIEIGGSKLDMDHVAINLVSSALKHDERRKGTNP